MSAYDPFAPGPFGVVTGTGVLVDDARGREFPWEVWAPAGGGGPAVVYSHHSAGSRRAATFLTRHLASHGYVVAALDHSEVVAPELRRPTDRVETPGQLAARGAAMIASRVPDLRLLLDALADGRVPGAVAAVGAVGAVGHSFGGWTVLAAGQEDPRIGAVVAHGPAGRAQAARPGVIPVGNPFGPRRSVPTLFIAAEYDTPVPVVDVRELSDLAPGPTSFAVLPNADHQHFADDVVARHEELRAMTLPAEFAWLVETMRPAADLADEATAHRFVRGLTCAHLDATLRNDRTAAAFLRRSLDS